MNKDKLLIISWTLHPWPTGSSIIVNNLAENMNRDNVVLVGEKHPTISSTWPDDLPKIYYVDPNVKIRGRGQTHLRWLSFFKIKAQLIDICQKERVDKILIIFPDDFYLSLAYSVSKKLNIPLFTWFHNTYLDNYSGYRKLFAKWLQPKVFQYANKTFVMSDGMLEYYNKQYPNNKFETLVHGFPIPTVEFEPFHLDQKRIKFVFTGSLNSSCEDAAIRLMSTILKNPNYEVHVYTGNPIEAFKQHGLLGKNFFFHGFIKLEDLYSKLKEYDIMLLPHGFDGARTDAEFKTIFPTRTIPLLCSNRPILAHTPKGVFLTTFLKDNDCAYIVESKHENEISNAIELIVKDENLRNRKIRNALKAANVFDILTVKEKLHSSIAS